tara:strand:+ start:410 stop:1312 length:903 start_codon:yes stop_codon:yes gene_type:complete
MSNCPLISILMNCYNADKFIGDAIESVLNQTYKNWELIVWDDASTDNTIDKIKKFKDKRIKIFYNENHCGLGKSRIKAQKNITGDYVAILDSDDKFKEEKLEKQINYFKDKNDLGMLGTNYEIINKNNKLVKKTNIQFNNENLLNYFCDNNIFAHSSIMYRKTVAEKVGWYSEEFEYSQDFDLTLKFLKKGKIDLISENLVSIRRSPTSMSEEKTLGIIREQENLTLLKKIRDSFKLNTTQKIRNQNAIKLSEIKYIILNHKTNNFKKIFDLLTQIINKPSKIFVLLNFILNRYILRYFK